MASSVCNYQSLLLPKNVKLSSSSSLNLSSVPNISLQFLPTKKCPFLSSTPRALTVISMAPPKPGGKSKKVTGMIKLALEAGKATPAPPVGPALGSKGVNIMAFCKDYNARTADKAGYVIPVEITVYDDKSFTFVLKTPPASVLLLKAAGMCVLGVFYSSLALRTVCAWLANTLALFHLGQEFFMWFVLQSVWLDKAAALELVIQPFLERVHHSRKEEALISFLAYNNLGAEKGAKDPKQEKVGKITIEQLRTIATEKLPDLNCTSIESAMRIIAGTAANMGIEVDPPVLEPKKKGFLAWNDEVLRLEKMLESDCLEP
ncbi:50S ribosomal protein L11, chloroplastic [Vitis vinifera]|uniref:50S ribosomal protein L11, chloroplastic n=1 Tax=Vitis vinifera TaxID=29760 RepID=A0A438BVC5_VITVI|nr:50S ribosomal protein L11, chloroplastic [Vitis vinifera]